MKKIFLLLICLLQFCLTNSQTPIKKISEQELSIGKTIEIESQILKEKRILNIYLPPAYDKDTSKSYPVIYLLDGSIDEDFLHISGIVQFTSFSWINIIPESIVVGIANVDRKKDFTYPSGNSLDQQEFPTSGHSGTFRKYLEHEVMPFIEEHYRTNNEKTLIGQSLGGLLGTEILLKTPRLFDNYILVSPSLWWDDENLLNVNISEFKAPRKIYIAVGKEGEVMERIASELHRKLKEADLQETALYFDYLEKKSHGDALHQAVYNALERFSDETGTAKD